MASTTRPGLLYKVPISSSTIHGTFTDSLYYTVNEFKAISESTLNAAINKRINDWVTLMTNMKANPPAAPTVAELLNEKADYEAAIQNVDSKIQILNGQ